LAKEVTLDPMPGTGQQGDQRKQWLDDQTDIIPDSLSAAEDEQNY